MNQELKPLRIGDIAAQSGCSVPTIRYYEEIGLLREPARRESGHRVYDASAVQLVRFIRRCRDFGFPIEQIRSLVAMTDGRERACLEARDLARAHLSDLRSRMLDLAKLERSLARFVDSCSALCADGPAPECRMLQDLGYGERTLATSGCCG